MTTNPTQPDASDLAGAVPRLEPWFARLARFSASHTRAVILV